MSKVAEKIYRIKKAPLALRFTVMVFVIMVFSMVIVFFIAMFLIRLGLYHFRSAMMPFLMLALPSIFVGIILSVIFSRIFLSPFRKMIVATDKLASGDFSVRLDLGEDSPELMKLSESFNHMAAELGNIEMLRADFVNNFSHEFKTPIVSMRGFAKMLKYENLSQEERNEYLDIIISESDRLSDLATNVLNLSKIENQTILSDQTTYNVSEQIRRVVALLENKWNARHMEIYLECEEINIYACAELLWQVWLNLLDNSIKFSPEYSVIEISVKQDAAETVFRFADQGCGIEEKSLARIFDKFYQSDMSHTTQGNGLGLTLVKKILSLHRGSVSVTATGSSGTTFEIRLPR